MKGETDIVETNRVELWGEKKSALAGGSDFDQYVPHKLIVLSRSLIG